MMIFVALRGPQRACIARVVRCMSTGGERRSVLRQLVEDAKLISGDTAGAVDPSDRSSDPTVLIAEHKIKDAIRRGVFENLEKAGKPLDFDAHRAAAMQGERPEMTSYIMASQLAAARMKPLSIELRIECEERRQKLLEMIQNTPKHERRASKQIRTAAEELIELIKKQHMAAIADAHAFSNSPLQVPPFDLDAELNRIN